jgi:hypothetical protein
MVNRDVVINIGASIEGLEKSLNLGQAKLKGFASQAEASAKKAAMSFDDVSSRINQSFNRLGGFLPETMLTGKSQRVIQSINQGMLELSQSSKAGFRTVKKEAGGTAQAFDEAALGLLFFGMQLKNFATGIIRSSTGVFNDVMHQIEGTVTNTDRLTGAFKFLQFQLGKAFDPLLGSLVPIVARMAEFVSQNESLVRVVTTVTGVLGTLGFLYGTFKLGIPATITALKDIKGAFRKFDDTVRSSTKRAKLFKSVISGLGGAISIGLAVEEADDAIQNFKAGNVIDGVLSSVATAAKGIGGIKFLQQKNKAGAAALAIGIAVDLVEENKLFTTIGSIIATVVGLMAALGVKILEGLASGIEGGVNYLIDEMNRVIDMINFVLRQAERLPGVSSEDVIQIDRFDEYRLDYVGDSAEQVFQNAIKNVSFGRDLDSWISEQKKAANASINEAKKQRVQQELTNRYLQQIANGGIPMSMPEDAMSSAPQQNSNSAYYTSVPDVMREYR